jgi:hypothetical protein
VAGALGEQLDPALVASEDDAQAAVQRLGANVLVVNEESLDGEAITDLLRQHPDVHVIGISADGRQAYAQAGSRAFCSADCRRRRSARRYDTA